MSKRSVFRTLNLNEWYWTLFCPKYPTCASACGAINSENVTVTTTEANPFMDPPTGESVGCNRRTLRGRELSPAQLRHWEWPASPPSGGFVRRVLTRLAVVAVVLCPEAVAGQSPTPPPARPATDLDGFMAKALQRRDIDRKTLSDYVLDEVEEFEVLGPGRVPFV